MRRRTFDFQINLRAFAQEFRDLCNIAVRRSLPESRDHDIRGAAHQEITGKYGSQAGKRPGAAYEADLGTFWLEERLGEDVRSAKGTARAGHSGSHEIFGSWRAPLHPHRVYAERPIESTIITPIRQPPQPSASAHDHARCPSVIITAPSMYSEALLCYPQFAHQYLCLFPRARQLQLLHRRQRHQLFRPLSYDLAWSSPSAGHFCA